MDLYSPYGAPNMSNNGRLISVVALATVLGVSVYWLSGLVSEYGWQGALNYIWEGDPYPNLRNRLDKLELVERKIVKPEKLLVQLETALQKSELDTIDAAEASSVVEEWQSNLPSSIDLRTRLGLLSSDLDKLAAQVDGVVSEGSTVLKERKKVLSKRLVQLMERVDVLIAFFRKGRDSSNQETVSQ